MFTKTIKKALLQENVEYSVVIGAGGIALSGKNAYGKVGPAGGNTVAFGYTVEGGKSASSTWDGGNGGSGGGVGGTKSSVSTDGNPGDGASDKALLPANLVKQPGNSMPVAELAVWVLALQPQLPGARVAEQSNRLLPQLILAEAEAEAGRRKSCREITCLTPVPAAAVSCA